MSNATQAEALAEFLLAQIAEDDAEVSELRKQIPAEQLAVYEDTAARVLAESAAKRRIMELHTGDRDPADCTPRGRRLGEPCDTLLALASTYGSHPDFREEWRA